MNYLAWAIIALVVYGMVPPLVKVAVEDTSIIMVALVSNPLLALANLGVVLYLRESPLSALSSPSLMYVLAVSVFLTVDVLGTSTRSRSAP